ncbi:MAG TPA: glycoside hydrolase family 13 protein [Candidatus Limnocylindrales bacterium]|nr:glycoside hydrolase family 13 protein [Candidatus Limnocylindrales bacterium]
MLDQPHHDGSQLYVAEHLLWVRVPAGFVFENAYVRTVIDGEPRFLPLTPDPSRTGPIGGYGATDTWLTAKLPAHNPVTPYRFLFGSRWLNATGLHEREVTDINDFKLVTHEAPPPWMRDAIVYEIFPDRFASTSRKSPPEWAIPASWDTDPVIGSGPGVSEQLYGGDLDGVTARLDHIQSLGANTVYLTPVFASRSNHRYDASTFDSVDPLLGGDVALKRLSDALHTRGMRLIGDITTNHVGSSHEWFANDPEMFYFLPDGGYESWCGVTSLPKLNWGSPLVRERLVAVMRRWLEFFDGWRVDCANMTGRFRDEDRAHEVARELRRALPSGTALVAEHNHYAAGDLDRDGWHGTMNYGGFLRPIWTWLRSDELALGDFLGWPGNVPSRPGQSVMATIREFASHMSWRSYIHSWQLLDSHDAARIRTVTGSARRQIVAAGLQATMPGTPMLFAGSEFGLTGHNGEASRTPMPWNRPGDIDDEVFSSYRALFGLRTSEKALRHGGLRWIHGDADSLAFIRETGSESVVVSAARTGSAPIPALPNLKPLFEAPGLSIWRCARTA